MPRIITFLFLFLCFFVISAQDEVRLPADLRQHNLTTYNSSLFNAAFSLDRNDPESVALWTRWQWQSIDADPTTLFVNYSRRLNQNSAIGAAFFQHNTGIFFNTGGVLNYAYEITFSESVKLGLGFNLFGFVQQLADTRFQIDPSLPIPIAGSTNDFILQWAPGVSISVERMTLSLASENLLDYNFRANEANTPSSDKIFMGMMSYDFPLNIGSQKALLRPSLYLRTIPQQENQIGILSILRTEKYWAQLGYNNFYGVGIGAGGTFLKRFNLGALFEFGTSASINSKDPSFEIVASYFLGNPDSRSVVAVYEDEMFEKTLVGTELDEELIREELEKAEKLAREKELKDIDKQIVDDIQSVANQAKEPTRENSNTDDISKKERRKSEKDAVAEEKRLQKEQNRIAKEEKIKLEQIANEKAQLAKDEQAQIERDLRESRAKKEIQAKQAELAERQKEVQRNAEIQEAEIQRKLDSVIKAELAAAEAEKEEVKPKTGEKYEEVATEDGLEPGFYLIANVFGTKKYFDAFMADLTKQGLSPKSFLRSKNNYNYSYLDRFDTMAQARQARDSQFNGKYKGKTWVFRVVGK